MAATGIMLIMCPNPPKKHDLMPFAGSSGSPLLYLIPLSLKYSEKQTVVYFDLPIHKANSANEKVKVPKMSYLFVVLALLTTFEVSRLASLLRTITCTTSVRANSENP